MHRHRLVIVVALIGLVVSILACNAPTPTDQGPSPGEVVDPSPTSPPQEAPSPPPTTGVPVEDTATPTPLPPTETPSPTPSPTPTPTEAPPPNPTVPVSTGPLEFPVPWQLDHWRALENGEMEATIILHITGGAPPYTVYHDQGLVTTTWKTDPAIVFQARACNALVHTIIVESADGQTARNKYWIPAPWCD